MRECATSLEPEIPEDQMESLLKALKDSNLKGIHMEIGTAAGGTLCRLMRFYMNERDGKLPPFIVVDPMKYFPEQFSLVKQNLENHQLPKEPVSFWQSSSAEAFQQQSDSPPELDFILIDGNHKIKYVTEDLRWSRFLKPGGLLCFHDYEPRFPGVWLNAQRLLKAHPNYQVLSHVGTLLVLKKDAPSTTPEVSFTDQLWSQILAPWFQLKASIAKRWSST